MPTASSPPALQGFPKPGSEAAIGLSSGGFSSYWAQPSYQKAAVAAYLSSGAKLPPASRGYNVSGRAYPDISAQATDYCVTPFGCGVAGTSCATPAVSGIFGLLNDLCAPAAARSPPPPRPPPASIGASRHPMCQRQLRRPRLGVLTRLPPTIASTHRRLQNGKSTLGFLNPFIYQNAAAFNDVTTGANSGCGFIEKGWPATAGWDAVTGVGTPNYEKLAAAVAALP